MNEAPKFHNEALMPITMGSPFRVPDYAYENWGLGKYRDEMIASAAYKAEWDSGTAAQLGLVSQAIVRAGYGNYPVLLHKATANAVAGAVAGIIENRRLGRTLTIVDVGAGPGGSALATFEALPDEAKNRVTMVLVDPSADALETASQLMRERGANHIKLVGTDLEKIPGLGIGSVDILTGVASIHHHAQIPFDLYEQVLKPEGFAIFADWHQPIWEHPGNVLRFLERFDWPNKEAGIANWKETYLEGIAIPEESNDPMVQMAIEQITRFWLAYKEITEEADLGSNALWPLEGHRPVRKYAQEMNSIGLTTATPDIQNLIDNGVIDANPKQLLTNSSLLQVTIGQKHAT